MSTVEDLGAKLLFIISFLGLFFLIIAIAPSIMIYGTPVYKQYEVPTYFSAQDIQAIKYFKNYTVNIGDNIVVDFTPTPNYKFYLRWQNPPFVPSYLWLVHVDWEFWFIIHEHSLFWNNQSNIEYPQREFFEQHWDSKNNVSVSYAHCIDITVKVWVGDTNNTRNNITSAWNDGHLQVGIGFGYSDTEVKLSSWDIITRLLTFQAPQIFGSGSIGLAVNVIIALPIYAMIAYLIYRLVLMAIPFVGG
jgi:hypothetical protein